MKLRRGRDTYKVPEHYKIMMVLIEGNQRHNQIAARMVMEMPSREMMQRENKTLGLPNCFAVVAGDRIRFWPTPDKAYAVKVRYVPPVQEF